MYYGIGLDVIVNTFNDNYLVYDLTAINSTNGTPALNRVNVAINGTDSIRLGRGYFTTTNGGTHTYQLDISFKNHVINQNNSQNAVFNAKITARDSLDELEGWRNPNIDALIAAFRADPLNQIQEPITTGGTDAFWALTPSAYNYAGDIHTGYSSTGNGTGVFLSSGRPQLVNQNAYKTSNQFEK